jgi:hypothetical protein
MLLPQILLLQVAAFEYFRGRTATRQRGEGEAQGSKSLSLLWSQVDAELRASMWRRVSGCMIGG